MMKKLHERMEVLYEDQDVIVIEKAAGILSYPVRGRRQEGVIQLIRRYWRSQNSQNQQLYLLHRLDQETSGLMVFAKSSLARKNLRIQFEKHSVVRGYLAVTAGIPAKRKGSIKTLMGRDTRGRRSVAAYGKLAVTHYQVLKEHTRRRRALIRCILETGRTHQIRIHLAHLRIPVLGDRVYGAGDGMRLALHASILGFQHPRHGQPLMFVSSLPEELRMALL